jgi:hypothetical protein
MISQLMAYFAKSALLVMVRWLVFFHVTDKSNLAVVVCQLHCFDGKPTARILSAQRQLIAFIGSVSFQSSLLDILPACLPAPLYTNTGARLCL